MKRINTVLSITFSMSLLFACNSSDGPAYDPSIVVPHKDSVSAAVPATTPVNPIDSMTPAQINGQTVPQPAAQPVAAGMNPAHGQPGHRCDIPVGAPLNSPPGKQTAAPVAQTVTPAKTVTAPGMNPAHGQPGHRCDIAVGAPLNSAPAKPTTTTSETQARPVPAEKPAAVGEPAKAEAPSQPAEMEKKP